MPSDNRTPCDVRTCPQARAQGLLNIRSIEKMRAGQVQAGGRILDAYHLGLHAPVELIQSLAAPVEPRRPILAGDQLHPGRVILPDQGFQSPFADKAVDRLLVVAPVRAG